MASRQSLRARVEGQREQIVAALRRHRGVSISLFGSVARGEEHSGSDIDFLVEFEPGSSLFDLLHLRDELSDLLSSEVDVVSVGGLLDRDDHIRDEAVLIAAA